MRPPSARLRNASVAIRPLLGGRHGGDRRPEAAVEHVVVHVAREEPRVPAASRRRRGRSPRDDARAAPGAGRTAASPWPEHPAPTRRPGYTIGRNPAAASLLRSDDGPPVRPASDHLRSAHVPVQRDRRRRPPALPGRRRARRARLARARARRRGQQRARGARADPRARARRRLRRPAAARDRRHRHRQRRHARRPGDARAAALGVRRRRARLPGARGRRGRAT